MPLDDPSKAYLIRSKNVAWKVLDGESVVLNLDSGVYFTLNMTGTEVWERIDGATSLEEIGRGLWEQFEITVEQAQRDLLELTRTLMDEGLVRITDGTSTAPGTQRV